MNNKDYSGEPVLFSFESNGTQQQQKRGNKQSESGKLNENETIQRQVIALVLEIELCGMNEPPHTQYTGKKQLILNDFLSFSRFCSDFVLEKKCIEEQNEINDILLPLIPKLKSI